MSIFSPFKKCLQKTNNLINNGIDKIAIWKKAISVDILNDIEKILIGADIGLPVTRKIINSAKELMTRKQLKDINELKKTIVDEMTKILLPCEDLMTVNPDNICIMFIVGVNGVGKTTTIAKLANLYKTVHNKKVLLAAADTYRAAAVEQLKIWGTRNAVDVVAHKQGADSAAVVFDAIKAAQSRKIEILLIDTAGRLHNKEHLMHELQKMKKIINREMPNANLKTILILDGTMGQNTINQAETFTNMLDVNGIIVTKLDGTAKGGFILNIAEKFKIPIEFIGTGEQATDLTKFEARKYAEALIFDED